MYMADITRSAREPLSHFKTTVFTSPAQPRNTSIPALFSTLIASSSILPASKTLTPISESVAEIFDLHKWWKPYKECIIKELY